MSDPDRKTDSTLKGMKHNGLRRLLSWNRFSSEEMEALYQRYVFKLQQSSLVCMALLLTMLCLSLAALTSLYVKNYTAYSVYLYGQGLVFLGFFIYMKTKLREEYLMSVNYSILIFMGILAVLSCPLPLGFPEELQDHKLNMADGAWVVAFVIFNAYALMPLRTLAKCLFGGLLPLVHLLVSSQTCQYFPELLWRQVRFMY